MFSTVDTVGIPLTLLARRASSGRRSSTRRSGFRSGWSSFARARAARVTATPTGVCTRSSRTGRARSTRSGSWLGEGGPEVVFVPFGVDTTYFRPDPADAGRRRRRVDRSRPAPRLTRSCSPSREPPGMVVPSWSRHRRPASALADAPANVRVEHRPSLRARPRSPAHRRASSCCPCRTTATRARRRFSSRRWRAASRSWSAARRRSRAATTSRTASNCRPRPAGEPRGARERRSQRFSPTRRARAAIGARARETVEQHLTWGRYTRRHRRPPLAGLPHYGSRVTLRRALRDPSASASGAPDARSGASVATEVDRVRHRRRGRADLALFHEFAPPPYGGGNQFLRALVARARAPRARRRAEPHLARHARLPLQLVQLRLPAAAALRPAGLPDGAPRGRADRRLSRVRRRHRRADRRASTRELADATIVQSRFSLDAHRELGIELREPVVIPNAADPLIFYPPDAARAARGAQGCGSSRRAGRTTRTRAPTSSAGSTGTSTRSRFELTFVGRSAEPFARIARVGPLASERARGRASPPRRLHRGEPQRSVLERAARGARLRPPGRLPRERRPPGARRRRGHPVRRARRAAATRSIGSRRSSSERRAAIRVAPLAEVADRYLEVLRA